MAVFRVERNTGYTVMSNHHLRNKDLSLKAKLGCCPLFSIFARYRGEIKSSSLTFLRLSPYSFLAALMAAPKALKSYIGTGLFAIIIHHITFYSSPFFLDMSTQFIVLA